jgi:hypothetical protein
LGEDDEAEQGSRYPISYLSEETVLRHLREKRTNEEKHYKTVG